MSQQAVAKLGGAPAAVARGGRSSRARRPALAPMCAVKEVFMPALSSTMTEGAIGGQCASGGGLAGGGAPAIAGASLRGGAQAGSHSPTPPPSPHDRQDCELAQVAGRQGQEGRVDRGASPRRSRAALPPPGGRKGLPGIGAALIRGDGGRLLPPPRQPPPRSRQPRNRSRSVTPPPPPRPCTPPCRWWSLIRLTWM